MKQLHEAMVKNPTTIGCYFCRHLDGTLSNLSKRENTAQHRAYRIPFSFLRPYTTNYIRYGEY